MQSIDIIDECVNINYNIKKQSMKMKSSPKRYIGKYPILYTPQPNYLDEEEIATGCAKHSIIKPGTPQSRGKKETAYENLPGEVIQSMICRPGSPAGAAKFPISAMGPMRQDSLIKLPTLRKDSSFSPSRKVMFRSDNDDNNNKNINANITDLEARRIQKAVENELSVWWKKFPLKRDDKDERGFFAEDLTETYIVRRLDKFPVTTCSFNIRKEIVSLIEIFENFGKLPYRISGDKKHEEVSPMTNYAKEKARAEEEKAERAEKRKKLLEEEKEKKYLEKKRKEKELRKLQYEEYMKGIPN